MTTPLPYRVGDEPVPGFKLLGFLGRGGFGEVWKASAPGGTEIALKLIQLDDATGRKEFRSLRLVKRLRHPNLVPIIAYWLKDKQGRLLDDENVRGLDGASSSIETARWRDTPHAQPPQPLEGPAELIIAMGLGEANLAQRLRECQSSGAYGLAREELLAYMADAARAIDYLNRPVHDLGSGQVAIQHCDIKPHNLLVVGGALQVCDFGLASILSDVRTTSAAAGTIAYAAPECFRDGKPSASTDQYSLAVTYYELAAGVLPYDDDSLARVSQAVLSGQLNFLRVSLPEQDVLRRATSPDPGKRFATATEMVQALAQAAAKDSSTSETTILRQPPVGSLPTRALLAGLAGVLLLAGIGVWQYSSLAERKAKQSAAAAREPYAIATKPLSLKPGEPAPAAEVKPAPEFTNELGMKLMLIPAGEFLMGSDESSEQLAQAFAPLPEGFDKQDEQPRHPVRITHPFYMGSTEVTVGQFRQFVDATGYKTEAEKEDSGGWGYAPQAKSATTGPQFNWRDWGITQSDDSPVANVSWDDAQAFCQWLSQRESKQYRLPTEAQWEYACRAGTTTRFSSGDTAEDLKRVANFAAVDSYTAAVASRDANAFGLHDMHGNVAEWCSDGYAKDYYATTPADNPRGPEASEHRILRGGSWTHPAVRCRSSYRGFDSPHFRSGYVGFRVVCEGVMNH